jgi:hypothetical protein
MGRLLYCLCLRWLLWHNLKLAVALLDGDDWESYSSLLFIMSVELWLLFATTTIVVYARIYVKYSKSKFIDYKTSKRYRKVRHLLNKIFVV